MSLSVRAVAASILAGAAFAVISVAPASATTFCVPDFSAACPNNGTNVKQPNLETAMSSNATDGVADTIHFGPSTYTDPNVGPGIPGTLEPVGTDDLEVIGSGTGSSFITSAGTSNQFAVNLDASNRKTSMSNLTIIIPASFPDGLGAGLQAKNGTFDHVNIESLNPGSDGAPSLIGNTVWKDSRIYGAMGGTIDRGMGDNSGGTPGSLQIVRTSIEDASWGVDLDDKLITTVLKQSRIIDPVAYGVIVSGGTRLSVENSVFKGGGQQAIAISTSAVPTQPDSVVSVKNSTLIAGSDPTDVALKVQISGAFGSHNADVTVTDSILRGYENTWDMVTPAGPGIGHATLTFTDSNFNPNGLPVDSPVVNTSDPGNINQDPLFAGTGDYHLLAGSPSIDAGDPAAGGILEDFDGNARPLDGNGDGTRVRDQGAFEAPEIPTCATTPSVCPIPPDTAAPKITKLKFRHGRSPKKGGSLKFSLSEAATVGATFKPVPANKKGQKKRKTVKLTKKAKAGGNSIVIRKRKLRPGRYRLTITATDAAGNKSNATTRKVTVKG